MDNGCSKEEGRLYNFPVEKAHLAVKWIITKMKERELELLKAIVVNKENVDDDALIQQVAEKFVEEEKLGEDLMELIKNSWRISNRYAVISSAETFLYKRNNGKSLKDVLDKYSINLKGYVFLVTITESEIIVIDGMGKPRKNLFYDYEKDEFSYNVKLVQHNRYS